VAACSKQALRWPEGGGEHPVLDRRIKTVGYTSGPLDTCAFCQKFCEDACPRLSRWVAIEAKATLSARTRGPIKSGAPNDVIRSILAAGRSAALLDGVVMLDLDPWELKPVARVANTVEDIADSVGPQYLWAPVFDALNEAVFERRMENVAVVGTPCAAQAVRKIKASPQIRLRPYQDAIRLSIAVFCTGIYKSEVIDDILVKRMGVPRNQVKRLEVSADRESLRAVLWDGSVRTISHQVVEHYTRAGCATCDDYLGESADLAIGKLGAGEDTSTLIVRTQAGDLFARNAIQMNLLEATRDVDRNALAAAGEKGRRERAQAFKDLHILMLDALADPLKRGEAITHFVRLYRTPTRSEAPVASPRGCSAC
jgi:coenzyme F420 hydrogenase subunit beta